MRAAALCANRFCSMLRYCPGGMCMFSAFFRDLRTEFAGYNADKDVYKRQVYALAAHFLIPSVEEAGRLTLLLCVGLAIGIAVVIYGVLVLALHCIRRSDLELLPKGDKLARLLHIS